MDKPDWSDATYQTLFNLFLVRAELILPGKCYPADMLLLTVEDIKDAIDSRILTLANPAIKNKYNF